MAEHKHCWVDHGHRSTFPAHDRVDQDNGKGHCPDDPGCWGFLERILPGSGKGHRPGDHESDQDNVVCPGRSEWEPDNNGQHTKAKHKAFSCFQFGEMPVLPGEEKGAAATNRSNYVLEADDQVHGSSYERADIDHPEQRPEQPARRIRSYFFAKDLLVVNLETNSV